MKLLATLLTLGLATTMLAGCSDAPPSGEFTISDRDIVVDGSVEITYTEFENPLDPGAPEPIGGAVRCAQDSVPGLPEDQKCTYPSTEFSAHFMALSLPAANVGYTLFFVNSTEAVEIGMLQEDGGGMFVLNNTFNVDMSGDASSQVELRMGEMVVATAPANEGPNPFTVAPALMNVAGSGSYQGRTLNVDVTGLPTNATATGWLVTVDEGGKEHVLSFGVTNGANTYEADANIASYDEFHIHLGGSKINLGIAVIA